MAFEALQNCDHPHPEFVMLVNDDNDLPACSGRFYDEQYIGINFDEKEYKAHSYGVQRATLHHEAAHIVRQEYSTDKTKPLWHRQCQNDERTADHLGTINAGCVTCAREHAQDFLNDHRHTDHTHSLLKSHKDITLADLDHMPSRAKKKLLQRTYKISKKLVKEHPVDLERALRIHQNSLFLGNELCTYHQKHSDMPSTQDHS